MKSTIDRVPKSLSEYLNELAKNEGRKKIEIYKRIEDQLKGKPVRKKDDKPPYAF
jgi:predicted DNA-binding protein